MNYDTLGCSPHNVINVGAGSVSATGTTAATASGWGSGVRGQPLHFRIMGRVIQLHKWTSEN